MSVSRFWSHISLNNADFLSLYVHLVINLFICPRQSSIIIFPLKENERNDAYDIKKKGYHAGANFPPILNSSENSSHSFNYSQLERSLRRGANSDKSSVTSISLEIIWCQSLYLLRVKDSGGRIDLTWQIFGGETQRKEMRKGCDLPCSDPFILSLNLIGLAQVVPYIAHLIVRTDNRDFLCCCFIRISKGIHVQPLKSITRRWIQQNGSWHEPCHVFGRTDRNSGAYGVATDLLTTKRPILFNVILHQLIVGVWSRSAYLCACWQLVWYSAPDTVLHCSHPP